MRKLEVPPTDLGIGAPSGYLHFSPFSIPRLACYSP